MRNLRQEQRDERRQLRRGEQPQEGAPTPAPAPAPAPVNAAGDTGGSSGSMPAVGTPERKAEYDRRGWAYDDTIDTGSKGGGYMDYIHNMGSKFGLF